MLGISSHSGDDSEQNLVTLCSKCHACTTAESYFEILHKTHTGLNT